MELDDEATALPTIDCYPPELANLCVVAVREINEHTASDGCCVVCGVIWPCERAVLAEHNLALF